MDSKATHSALVTAAAGEGPGIPRSRSDRSACSAVKGEVEAEACYHCRQEVEEVGVVRTDRLVRFDHLEDRPGSEAEGALPIVYLAEEAAGAE